MKFFNLLAVSMFMLAMVMMSCSKQDIGTNNLYNQLDARQGGSTDTTASGGGGGGGGVVWRYGGVVARDVMWSGLLQYDHLNGFREETPHKMA